MTNACSNGRVKAYKKILPGWRSLCIQGWVLLIKGPSILGSKTLYFIYRRNACLFERLKLIKIRKLMHKNLLPAY